jgi:hypothetical protein
MKYARYSSYVRICFSRIEPCLFVLERIACGTAAYRYKLTYYICRHLLGSRRVRAPQIQPRRKLQRMCRKETTESLLGPSGDVAPCAVRKWMPWAEAEVAHA